jgi:hypothetical protein
MHPSHMAAFMDIPTAPCPPAGAACGLEDWGAFSDREVPAHQVGSEQHLGAVVQEVLQGGHRRPESGGGGVTGVYESGAQQSRR